MTDYAPVLDDIERIMRSACEKYLGKKPRELSHKTVNDILTDTDLKMQEYILNGIRESYPELAVIAEEKKDNALGDGLYVCVDPLDGTCNFSAGIPLYGVQAALLLKREPVASVIYLPLFHEVYKAVKGKGVSLNGKKLALDRSVKRAEAVLLISDFYPQIAVPEDLQYALVKSLRSKFLKTRLFGAACFDFATLITGKAQAYLCYYHELWDIAPGLLMAKELGMSVCGLEKAEYALGDAALIVAASEEIKDDVVRAYYALK